MNKEETIKIWQAQAARAAAMLSDPAQWKDNDGAVWALLECLGKDYRLNEILYDISHPTYGPPEPDWAELRAIKGLEDILEDNS